MKYKGEMMKVYTLKCSSCNANIEFDEGMTSCYCKYCGCKNFIDDEIERIEITKNINYHKTYTDEARIKEYETKEHLRLKELEYKDNEEKRNDKGFFLFIGVLMLMIVFCLMYLGGIFTKKPKDGEIQISVDVEDFHREDYKQVLKQLESAGFTNIECVPLGDLINGWLTKENSVKSVSIAGDSKFDEGDIFSKDAKVIITYHSFEE